MWATATIDHHIVAGITLFGMVLDVLGALYLAYDLLGGRRGPLQALTELISLAGVLVVTAGIGAFTVLAAAELLQLRILHTMGYQETVGASIAFSFGAVPGILCAYAVALTRMRRKAIPSFHQVTVWRKLLRAMPLSLALGLELGLCMFVGARRTHGLMTGLIGGTVGGFCGGLMLGWLTGQVLVHELPPEDDLQPPRFDPTGLLLGVLALLPTGLVASLSYWAIYGPQDTAALLVALAVGGLAAVVGGAGGGTGIGLARRLDWWVGRLPPRRLGAFGAGLILAGFVLQSVQYWLVEFDVHIR